MLQGSKFTKYDYDFENDSVFFYGTDKKYKHSIDLDGIILDISEDAFVMAIEILDVSKKFNVPKKELLDIKNFKADIEISKETIKISMELGLNMRNGLVNRCVEALGLNNMNLPVSSQGIALCC
jgi:uncharacterized protein YuzE